MTKKSRLQNLRAQNKNEAQKSLKQAEKIASEHDGEIVEESKIAPLKGVITFKMEDVIVGRSKYNIMENVE